MERDGFVFYRSFYEGIKDLPRDIQGEVLTAIMEYGLNGVTTENLKPVARAIFTLIKPQIDANNQKFINGKSGGRPPKEKPNHNQEETKPKPKHNQSITKQEPKEKVKVKDKVKEESKSIPPEPPDQEYLFSEEKKEVVEAVNDLVKYFHDNCSRLPKVQVISKSRKSSIKARISDYGLEKVKEVLKSAGESNFLAGENRNQWTADFDWILKPTNFVKILEGNYNNKDLSNGQSNNFNTNNGSGTIRASGGKVDGTTQLLNGEVRYFEAT
ncbi:DUF6291 domain-containing protein [Chryseobacterium indologenes]|uniref:DUF6291 domain-containing protein n=1 Tax=Chryseobacterium indologenes TaxID=253 RepID=UPI000787D4F0|nr:DUF6291 domain-containing protein [Chryseobacterium indologenes]